MFPHNYPPLNSPSLNAVTFCSPGRASTCELGARWSGEDTVQPILGALAKVSSDAWQPRSPLGLVPSLLFDFGGPQRLRPRSSTLLSAHALLLLQSHGSEFHPRLMAAQLSSLARESSSQTLDSYPAASRASPWNRESPCLIATQTQSVQNRT